MARWSIRDLWGRLTQKKALNPEVRNVLMSLDGVYEPTTSAPGAEQSPDGSQQKDETRRSAR